MCKYFFGFIIYFVFSFIKIFGEEKIPQNKIDITNKKVNIKIEYKKAIELLNEKKFNELVSICNDELDSNPSSLMGVYFMFIVHTLQNDNKNAKIYLEKFKETFKSKAEVSGSIENGLMVIIPVESEKNAKLTHNGVRVLTNDNNEQFYYLDAYYAIASEYLEKKDCKNALYWLNAAKHPTNQDEFYLGFQGYCNYMVGRYDVSRNYYKALLPNASNKDIVTYSIAATYAQESKTTEAIEWLKKSIELNPKFFDLVLKDEDKDFVKIRDTILFKETFFNK